jgi:hypothetical protein
MLDKDTRPKRVESGPPITISREGYEAPNSRMGTLAVPARRGWRRRLWGLGAMAGMLILLLLVGANLGISADWWRQGTVWKEFNRGQKLMYLQGYSAGFLAGAQQAFKNPDGLKDFYKSLAQTNFRQGEVLISQYLKNNPHKLNEPLGNLIFEAYNEAAKGPAKAPERVIAAKSAPKPPETPVAKDVPPAPEKVPAAKDVPQVSARVPAAKDVSKNFEEIKLGDTKQSQPPKSSEKIGEVKKAEVQVKGEVKGRVNPPPSTSAYTPPRESIERKSLFFALSEIVDPSRTLRLSFVVKSLKVNNGWAWVFAVPQSQDGEIRYSPVYALLHQQGGTWKVEAQTRAEKNNPDFLFNTGYLEKLTKRFPQAPPDIFPAVKGVPKPSVIPAVKDVSKAPEKVLAPKDVPKPPERVSAAQKVPKPFEEIQLGAAEQSRLPKSSGEIKEVKKDEVQTKTEIKGRVNPPPSTRAYTPPRESDERTALFVSLREYMDPSKMLRLNFIVQDLKVNNGWAWVFAMPQSRDGEIQYAPVYALLHHQEGSWKVKAYTRTEKGKRDFLSATGYLKKLKKRFPEAPSDIFPHEGD